MTNRRLTKPFTLFISWLLAAAMVCTAAPATKADDEPQPGFDQLHGQFTEAYKAEDYTKALELAEKMNELVEPQHVETLYNIACLHCLLGHKDKTYEWLEKAVDAGYWDVRHLMRADDLQSIRKEERFRAMVKRVWLNGYIAMLEREERAEFQKPEQVMATLAFKPGERVADVGAGSGYFTIPVAKVVGPSGVVWAIDIHQEMLDYIEKRLGAHDLQNVRLMKVGPDDPQLPAGGVDTILMIDTLHYIQQRSEYAKKLRMGLAPGGRVVIIDYKPKPFEERPWGPLPEQQIPRETVDADFAEAGLKPVKVHDFLPEQYFVEYEAR